MRTGILGGSFDPVHQQHLQLALAALIECCLDEVWFVPVFQAVHKQRVGMLDYHHRRHLLQTALKDSSHMHVCDVEMELGGPSYTFRTLEVLQERHPERQFFLIIGGDSLAELPTWKNVEQLVKMTEFIVVERPGCERRSPVPDAVIHWAPCQLSKISSTQIRNRLINHDFNLPELDMRVLLEIMLSNHYDCLGPDYHRWLKLVEKQQKRSPEGLQEHMKSVTCLAIRYAIELGVDPRPVLIAGLAHDLFRDAPDAEIISLVGSTDFLLTDLEKEMPMLAHGPAAAAWLRQVAPEIDSAIISAVKNHTFPVADSPLLTRILAVADTLDPVRQVAERDALREADLSFAERYQGVLEIKKKSHM